MNELIDYLVRQARKAYAKKHRTKSKLAITQAELQRLGRLREEANLLCDNAFGAVRQAEEAHQRAETHVESIYAAYDRLDNQYRVEQYHSMKAYAAWKAAKKELASHRGKANDAQQQGL